MRLVVIKQKKFKIVAISIVIIILLILIVNINIKSPDTKITDKQNIDTQSVDNDVNKVGKKQESLKKEDDTKSIIVDKIIINSDKNANGILDLDEIVLGARIDAKNKPAYTDKYYSGGYPPDNEGVCTDVIWRAFKNAGYNLKNMIDTDIKGNLKLYPRVEGKPDPNIDFRRVPNLVTFFNRKAQVLTLELKANDVENLKQWQGGDIVTFDHPQHVVIISDKRRKDGIPYIIHNQGPYTAEDDRLLYWMPKITGHFRYPK